MYFTVLQRFKTLQDDFILPKMIHFLKKGLQKAFLCGIISLAVTNVICLFSSVG